MVARLTAAAAAAAASAAISTSGRSGWCPDLSPVLPAVGFLLCCGFPVPGKGQFDHLRNTILSVI